MEKSANQGSSTARGEARGRGRWAILGAFVVVGMAASPLAHADAEMGPAISSDGGHRLDLFALSWDNAVWRKRRDVSFGAWERLPLIAASTGPDAVSQAPGKIDVVVAQRGTVYISSFNGAWSPWAPIGGSTEERPAICSWGPGRLDVFIRNARDNSLQHAAWQQGGPWSQWDSLGGVLTSAPDCVSWGPNRIDIVARGTDFAVHHIAWAGGWSGWDSLGGDATTAPAISSWGPGRLDVFARGTDHAVHHRAYENGWYGWDSIEGSNPVGSAPTAVSTGSVEVEVAYRDGGLGDIWLRSWDSVFGWDQWANVGRPPH
jgi:hypothetical protein